MRRADKSELKNSTQLSFKADYIFCLPKMLISDNPVEECDATKAPFCTNAHPKIILFSFPSACKPNGCTSILEPKIMIYY
jgi:hypothetical protein